MSPATLPSIKIFADCADFDSIKSALTLPYVRGFTTNPSLVAQTGVSDYTAYARAVLDLVGDKPVSFEVLAEHNTDMEREARIISSWGDNVYVKIPIVNPAGESMAPLIKTLARQGVRLNVTTVFTAAQSAEAAASLDPQTPALVSVFAGRIADTGVDPLPIVEQSRELLRSLPKTELLWASTRELYNIYQAASTGCHVVTAPLAMVRKLADVGKDLTECSRDAVRAFMSDIAKAGIRFSVE